MAELHHRGTRAVQRMVEHAPSSGGLALWVRHADVDERAPTAGPGPKRPPITTDGHTLHYAPDFETLSLPHQTGCVAHAVLHVALRHAQRFEQLKQRSGDADLTLFNLCADAVVNTALGHLAWLELPAQAVRLEQLLGDVLGSRQAPEAALLAWDVERLYRAIDDRGAARSPKQDPQAKQDESRRGSTRPDGERSAKARILAADQARDLVPSADTQGPPQAEAEATREWHERLIRAHANDGDHSMLRTLLADAPRMHTPWEQALRSQLAHALVHEPSPSWSRPARSWLANQGRTRSGRRLPWEPGTASSRPVPKLAVIVDVSGSVDDVLMARFAGEVDAISRRHEAGLVLVIGDERVREVRHAVPGRSGLREIVFEGGGGTDFTPLLEEAARHRPDIMVVLTDLQGPARWRPRHPVIWAVPEAFGHAVPPFGRLLVLQ